MKSFLAALLLLATSVLAQTPSQKHPFTFEDMMKLKRVGAPVPSPDGRQLAWTSTRAGGSEGQIFLAQWNHEKALDALRAAPERKR